MRLNSQQNQFVYPLYILNISYTYFSVSHELCNRKTTYKQSVSYGIAMLASRLKSIKNKFEICTGRAAKK